VKRVSGPPSDKGKPVYANKEQVGYEHVGRTETPCLCGSFLG
jgi:hypothetical protein